MSEIDAKVNMSLDEIIKMENKKKRQKEKVTGFKGARGKAKGNVKGRGPQGRRNVQKKKMPAWKRQGKVQAGFIRKKNGANTLFRSRSNINLNRTLQKNNLNLRNNFISRRLNTGRIGLARSKSRANLNFIQTRYINENKMNGKRTTSMPNLRDPNSVHNRLGYQSPAQIAYRNRIKRAKQLLIQNQKLGLQNNARINQTPKPLTTLQRALELRQQSLIPQRGYGTGGLRSDLILRAQRRAQYEEKLMRIKAYQMNNKQDVKLIYPMVQRSVNNWFPNLKTQNAGNGLQQLSRGRSPFRQAIQTIQQRTQSFNRQRRSRSRSRSRTRHRNISITNNDLDDRTFSEVMYSLSGGLGVTEKTLNERFSY